MSRKLSNTKLKRSATLITNNREDKYYYSSSPREYQKSSLKLYKARNPTSIAYLVSNLTSLSKQSPRTQTLATRGDESNRRRTPRSSRTTLNFKINKFKKDGFVALETPRKRQEFKAKLYNSKAYEVKNRKILIFSKISSLPFLPNS